MMKTRSGKNLIGAKQRSQKSAVPVVIFEDNSVESKKRESPCNMVLLDSKKKKPAALEHADKENTINSNNGNREPALAGNLLGKKKIELSVDEKSMSGAPEGDIFDLVVFEDAELLAYADDGEASSELERALVLHDETTVWADRYEAVVIIRRAVLHHPQLLSLDRALACAVQGVEALRSCQVRSSILCLAAALQRCSGALSQPALLERMRAVIGCLLLRTGTGPRFISELAMNALRSAAPHMPLLLVRCLAPHVSHRNPDVASSAVLMCAEAVAHLGELVNPKEGVEGGGVEGGQWRHQWKYMLQVLVAGLGAKRPKAKDAAKGALRALSGAIGDSFQEVLHLHCSPSQVADVARLCGGGSGGVGGATPSSRPPVSSFSARPGSRPGSCLPSRLGCTSAGVRAPMGHMGVSLTGSSDISGDFASAVCSSGGGEGSSDQLGVTSRAGSGSVEVLAGGEVDLNIGTAEPAEGSVCAALDAPSDTGTSAPPTN